MTKHLGKEEARVPTPGKKSEALRCKCRQMGQKTTPPPLPLLITEEHPKDIISRYAAEITAIGGRPETVSKPS